MAEFGWAYVAGGAVTGALGPTSSVMLKSGELQISGSSRFLFNTSSYTLQLLGDLSGSGNVSGSAFYGSGQNLTNITFDQVTDANSTTSNAITIGGLTSTGNAVITGSLSVSGSLYANELITNVVAKSVTHISATGSTSFGDSADDTHTFTGAITGSKLNLTGLIAGTATTSSYLAVDSNNNIVLTSVEGSTYSRAVVTSTITASVNSKLLGVSASAPIEIRLPSAAGYIAGQHFIIKDEGGNANNFNITIKPSGSQIIDGETSIILESAYAAVNIYSDGSTKFFIY